MFLCFVAYFCISLVLVLPQILPFFDRTVGRKKGRFFEIVPLWAHLKRRPISFWYDGLGPFIVLALVHGVIIADSQQLKWYFPCLVVWVISNGILYQPWFMDNTKVFNAGWTSVAVAVVSNFLAKLWLIPRIILIVFCCASGSIPITRMATQRYPFWGRAEGSFDLANWAKKNSDPKSIWITGTLHHHPVLMFAGRQTFLGPYNYLSTHGVDPGERFDILHRMKTNPDDTTAIDRFNVEFICGLDGDEWGDFPIQPESLKWKKMARFGRFTVWKRMKGELRNDTVIDSENSDEHDK
jgi:hypothetical protein